MKTRQENKFLACLAEYIINMVNWNETWWSEDKKITLEGFLQCTRYGWDNYNNIFRTSYISMEYEVKLFDPYFKELIKMKILESNVSTELDTYGNKIYGRFYKRLPVSDEIKNEIFFLKLL